MAEPLELWTIYGGPRDFPGLYPVRRWRCVGGKTIPDPIACLASSLEEARATLPPGLYNLGREPTDDPAIVETWI